MSISPFRPFEDPPSTEVPRKDRVPEAELRLEFVRSSGPGGQKVNKTSSKAQLRWNVGKSSAFSEEEKARIRMALANRINVEDEVVLASDQFRSQFQNKTFVIDQLQHLVDSALAPVIKRVATKPTRASKERRREGKQRQSRKKAMRRMDET